MKNIFFVLVLTTCGFMLLTCGGGGSDSNTPPNDGDSSDGGSSATTFSREDMLINLSSTIMNQAYIDFANQAQDLDLAAAAFVNDPSETNFTALRDAWAQALISYKYAEMFNLGLVDTLRLDNQIHFWPIRINTVQTALSDTTPIDATYMQNLGVGGKGLGTLEFFLYSEQNGQAPLEWLTVADQPRRLLLVRGITQDLLVNAQRVQMIWSPEGENFVNELGDATNGTDTYPSFRVALSAIVNQFVFDLEFIRNNKVGKPFGVDSGGQPRPNEVEMPYAQNSLAVIRANLEACLALFTGDTTSEGDGLLEYLIFIESDLGPGIQMSLEEAIASADSIELSLSEASEQRDEKVQKLYDHLNDLVLSTKVDMANVMGVSITFNDNDGD